MKRLLVSILIGGCSPVSQIGAQVDGSLATNTCNGTGDAFTYAGAFTFDAYDFGMVTSAGKIVGLAGSATNADLLAFNTTPLGEIETLGDHDVAARHLTALRGPAMAQCDTGNTVCHGYFAHAGTLTVHALHPRYQVTFTLSELFERVDNSGPEGSAIAGSITGCIDKANP